MQALITWVTAHPAMVGGVVVAVLDLVFALVPSWQSNGLLHWLYVTVQGMITKTPSP